MLSIIIPTLNEEKYLPLLLLSIKKQNFKGDYEIIVADAGSVDKTVEIAEGFGCRIIAGGLPAKGRNEGAKAAKGDILLFMDSDNISLPKDLLVNILAEFGKRQLAVASFTTCPKGKLIDKIIYGIYNNFVNLTQIPYATNSILIRKDIFEKAGGFDEEIKIAEDHSLAKQAAKFGKFGFIKTAPVLTSVRRFDRESRLRTYAKYIVAAIHLFLFGPIKRPIFKYRFNDLKIKENKKDHKKIEK